MRERLSYERGEEQEEQCQPDSPQVEVHCQAHAEFHETELQREVRNAKMEAGPHEGIVRPEDFPKHRAEDRPCDDKRY